MNFGSYTNLTDIITAISNKIKGRDKTFNGTHADWSILTTEEKKQYDFEVSGFCCIFADKI